MTLFKKKDPDITSAGYLVDYTRFGTQNAFSVKYKQLSNEELAKLPHKRGDMENAYQHAYVAALIAYNTNEDTARWFGYWKEVYTEAYEKHSNGKENAALDTNRDLWNNEVGIKYALEGKKQGKSFEEIGDEIFKNLQKKDSDFIINYKTDTRRWDSSVPVEKIWDKVNEKHNSLKYQSEKMIKNVKNIFNSSPSKTKKESFKVNFNNISYDGKRWNEWSDGEKNSFMEGFETGNATTRKEEKETKKNNWTKKFNIGNPASDKGHWVTLENGKHLFIKDS